MENLEKQIKNALDLAKDVGDGLNPGQANHLASASLAASKPSSKPSSKPNPLSSASLPKARFVKLTCNSNNFYLSQVIVNQKDNVALNKPVTSNYATSNGTNLQTIVDGNYNINLVDTTRLIIVKQTLKPNILVTIDLGSKVEIHDIVVILPVGYNNTATDRQYKLILSDNYNTVEEYEFYSNIVTHNKNKYTFNFSIEQAQALVSNQVLSENNSSVTASVQHCNSYLAIGYDQAEINCIRYDNKFINLPESLAPQDIAEAIIRPEIGRDNFADSYLIIGYTVSYEIDCLLVRNSTNTTFTQIGRDDPANNINAHFAQQNELREEANRGSVDFTPSKSNNTQNLDANVMTLDNEPEQMPLSNTQNLLDAAANLMANLMPLSATVQANPIPISSEVIQVKSNTASNNIQTQFDTLSKPISNELTKAESNTQLLSVRPNKPSIFERAYNYFKSTGNNEVSKAEINGSNIVLEKTQ